MKRRGFCKSAMYSLGMGLLPFQVPEWYSNEYGEQVHITILHTNDVHSRIEPFPNDGGRYAGKGGTAKRASIIEDIRAAEKNVLLFDSGDIFQGTPYFNMFGGELEMKLMSQMKYDAGTMGNHDFDAGIDGFDKQLTHAHFPFLTANYDFENTILKGKTKPYHVFHKEGIKIGVYGLGIKLENLVPQKLYGDTLYLDPIAIARETENTLREEHDCDYIICLSHLGYKYRESSLVSDITLAKNTRHTDLILGGHTHTFMEYPDLLINQAGSPCYIHQAGWAGIVLGRVDLVFEKTSRKKYLKQTQQVPIS